jgi:ribonuclease HI
MAKKKYYAVRAGRTPGIYTSWDACKAQVDGFANASFKSFPTKEEAEALKKQKRESFGCVMKISRYRYRVLS